MGGFQPVSPSDDRGRTQHHNQGGLRVRPRLLSEMENEMNEPKRVIGRIIKLSDSGWGFISSKEIKFTRIFFHWTSLQQDTLGFLDLKTGMMAEFTPIEVPGKGFRAIHVRIVEKRKENDANEMPALSE